MVKFLPSRQVNALPRLAGGGTRLRRETDCRRLGQDIGPAGPAHIAPVAHALLVADILQDQLPRFPLAAQEVLPILFDQAPGAAQLLTTLAPPPGPGHGPGTRGAENGTAHRPDEQAQWLFLSVRKPAENHGEAREDGAPDDALGDG